MRTPSKGYRTSVTDIAESVKRRKLFQDGFSAKVNDNIPDTLQLQHEHEENMNYIKNMKKTIQDKCDENLRLREELRLIKDEMTTKLNTVLRENEELRKTNNALKTASSKENIDCSGNRFETMTGD